jgi:hypothetical protein
MPSVPSSGKLYRLFTLEGAFPAHRRMVLHTMGDVRMIAIALAMFIALFTWGSGYFGWDDPIGKVQMALFTSFILGIVCGYKSKG